MKTMNYSIIRCICALVIGVLLVAWPEAAILYLVITIGVLFLVPGLFSCKHSASCVFLSKL